MNPIFIAKTTIFLLAGILILSAAYYLGYEKEKRVYYDLVSHRPQCPTPALTSIKPSPFVNTPTLTPTLCPKISSEIKIDTEKQIVIYDKDGNGFEIKYPNKSIIKEAKDEISIDLPFAKGTNLFSKTFVVKIDDYESEICSNERVHYSSVLNKDIKTIKIDGIDFKKIIDEQGATESDNHIIEYFGNKGNRCFILYFNLSSNKHSELPSFNLEKESEIFNQIIYSFKFIEK